MLPPSLIELAARSDTLSGKFTVSDAPPLILWDDGAVSWLTGDARIIAPNADPNERASYADLPSRVQWTDDAAPTKRTYVIGKAGPRNCNLITGTGKRLCARVLITPPNPQTTAQKEQRNKTTTAVQLWHTQQATCIEQSEDFAPSRHLSPYHRWLSYYLTTH